MPKAKNQHYVPQSYLTQFTSNATKIWVFDKFARRSYETNIKNVASETYFYDLTEKQLNEMLQRIQEKQADFTNNEANQVTEWVKSLGDVEGQLSKVETHLKLIMDKLILSIEKNSKWFTVTPHVNSLKAQSEIEILQIGSRLMQADRVDPKYKQDIAFLVALQLIRTKANRRFNTEFLKKSTKAISELVLRMKGIDTSELDINTTVTSEAEQLLHLEEMFNPKLIPKIVEVLMHHIWTFVVNETSQPFFTSDNPVVVIPHKFAPHRHYTGYASEGIEIQFPLTPKYAVVFYERTHFHELERIEGKVIPLEDDNVMYHNSAQVSQSYRQIYSPASSFELAEMMCREHPDITNPNRSHIDVS